MIETQEVVCSKLPMEPFTNCKRRCLMGSLNIYMLSAGNNRIIIRNIGIKINLSKMASAILCLHDNEIIHGDLVS